MRWWEAVVRVEAGASFGTGVLICPQVVLTAAHVLVSQPGGALPSEVRVLRVHGAQSWLGVAAFSVSTKWTGNAVDALVNDLAAIRLAVPEPLHLLPEPSRAAAGKRLDGAAYGYAGGASFAGHYLRGPAMSDGVLIESTSIRPLDGMSGGPVFADLDSGPGDDFRLVGMTLWTPTSPQPQASIGLVLRHDLIEGVVATLGN